LLLGLVLTLLQWEIVTSSAIRWMNILITVRKVGLIVSAVLYLSGFALLVRAALRCEALSGDNGGAALQLAMLFILLPCVPLVILFAIPDVMIGSHTQGWLLSVAGIAWVIAAVWVVKD
jgi:hypothetical protein